MLHLPQSLVFRSRLAFSEKVISRNSNRGSVLGNNRFWFSKEYRTLNPRLWNSPYFSNFGFEKSWCGVECLGLTSEFGYEGTFIWCYPGCVRLTSVLIPRWCCFPSPTTVTQDRGYMLQLLVLSAFSSLTLRYMRFRIPFFLSSWFHGHFTKLSRRNSICKCTFWGSSDASM